MASCFQKVQSDAYTDMNDKQERSILSVGIKCDESNIIVHTNEHNLF